MLSKKNTVMGKTNESLSKAFAQMSVLINNREELDRNVVNFKEQIADLKVKTSNELNKTNNGSEEFNEYKEAVLSGFSDLDSLLSDVSALINLEKPYVSLSDDLPFNYVPEDNISYSDYNLEAVTDYQIGEDSYSKDDLQQTNEIIINDDVRAEFSDFESFLEVYQYIKNNHTMEFYFGSRRGAVGALAEKADNDYDIASLLICVLRDRNIPARYT